MFYHHITNRYKFYSTEFCIYARLPIRSLTYETDQYFHDLQFSEKLLSTSRIHVPLIVQSYINIFHAIPVQRSQRSWVQILYRPEFFSGLIFTTAQVVFITAKIAFIFTSLSAVQIYDFHISTLVYSPLHRFIWLVSSVGRALHRYRRGHGFKSSTDLNFF